MLITCSDSTSPERKHLGLPNQFPLESGNAWIYERHYYESGTDSMVLDTLYILGRHNEYYKYSWSPNVRYNLVKNQNNKLINFGYVNMSDPPDTTIYHFPIIWMFFGEDTGFVDLEPYQNDYMFFWDSIHIGIKKDIKKFDNLYDAFITTNIKSSKPYGNQFSTVDGFIQWTEYNSENGEINRTVVMKQKMKDFYPPQKLIKKSTDAKDMFVPNGSWNYNIPDGIKRQKF